MKELRYFQNDAIHRTWEWFQQNDGNPLIVLPTGTGKSLVIAKLCETVVSYPNENVLVLAHVEELIGQNFSELIELWPEAPAGIYSAGLGMRDVSKRITFASIQSAFRRAGSFRVPSLIIVDECHLIPRNAETMYGKFFAAMRLRNPNVRIIGLTATPWRMDSGRMDEGDGRIFEGISYEYGIRQAIDDGFLCPPISKDTTMHLDVSGVGTRGGEFIPGQLEFAVDTRENNAAAVDEIVAFGADRAAWLVFCSGIDHATHVRDLVRERGVSCETLSADTDKLERRRVIQEYKAGRVKALTSMNLLTTGFNVPQVDLIALLRPTKSPSLYVQTVGRGTRPYPDKRNCLVLDFAGNVARFGPIDNVNVKKPGEGGGDAPVKICPECKSYVHAFALRCPDCGHVFPEREIKITNSASTAPIISQVDSNIWEKVDGATYNRHEKIGSPPSLKVTYHRGFSTFNEFVCFEHPVNGFARNKARGWWLGRGGGLPIPETVSEAISRTGEIRPPTDICVKKEGKYWSVVAHRAQGDMSNLLARGPESWPFATPNR